MKKHLCTCKKCGKQETFELEITPSSENTLLFYIAFNRSEKVGNWLGKNVVTDAEGKSDYALFCSKECFSDYQTWAKLKFKAHFDAILKNQNDRLESMKAAKTADEFAEACFPDPKMELIRVWKLHRKTLISYLQHRVKRESTFFATSKDIAEDIWKPEWDKPDNFFAQYRSAFIEWVENYIKNNS